MRTYHLKSFEDEPKLGVSASMYRRAAELEFEFHVSGVRHDVLWPQKSPVPRAIEGLYRSTCFEIFLALDGEPIYIEWNFSPSTDWYGFAFSAYRQAMPYVLDRLKPVSLKSDESADHAMLGGVVNLDSAMQSIGRTYDEHMKFKLGITSVVKAQDKLSYWALAHLSEKPDFHNHESFTATF